MSERETMLLTELGRLLEELGSDFCALGLLDPDTRILAWGWAKGNISDQYLSIQDKPGRGFHRSVVKIGRAMSLHVSELIGSRQLHEYPILLAEKLRSAYAVPLWKGREVAGVLLVGDRVRRIYRPEDRSRAAQAGERIAEILGQPAAGS